MDAPGAKADVLGQYAVVTVDRSLYSDSAIFKAAYWFTDKFYIFLDLAAEGRIAIELRQKTPDAQHDLTSACRDFCNALIDARVREQVLKETGGIREALITKAFSEGAVQPGLADAPSNERHLENVSRS